jgi:hypothetical protein
MRTKSAISAYSFAMLVCCILCFSSVKAQQKNGLDYRHSGFGLLNKKYFLDDVKMSKRSVGELLERENKEAYKVFKSARTNAITGTLLSIPSATLLMIGAGSYIFSGWGNVTEESGLLIAGIAGTTAAFILVISANRKFKKAADIYNHANSSTGKIHLSFGLTRSGGVGLTVSL